jgi:hypothetical protein
VYELSFSIRYRFLTTEAGITIPFLLKRNNLQSFGEAKVDPGSEYCLFQPEIADELQIDVLDGFPVKIGTLAGSFTAYAHTVELVTFELEFESTVLFMHGYGTSRNILGRIGWSNSLDLALMMRDETIYLNPIS